MPEKKKETGGPAFPCNSPDGVESYQGMTLRDWFAGKALPLSIEAALKTPGIGRVNASAIIPFTPVCGKG